MFLSKTFLHTILCLCVWHAMHLGKAPALTGPLQFPHGWLWLLWGRSQKSNALKPPWKSFANNLVVQDTSVLIRLCLPARHHFLLRSALNFQMLQSNQLCTRCLPHETRWAEVEICKETLRGEEKRSRWECRGRKRRWRIKTEGRRWNSITRREDQGGIMIRKIKIERWMD